jgi:galactose-1-phosphate uridylyltransferase
MKGSIRLRFERRTEQAGFFSPLAGMEHAEQTIEVRSDPLMGTTAVTSSQLRLKEEMFFGTTDWGHAEKIAMATRQGCFFCPERVYDVTPRYADDVVEGGRLRREGIVVFPNLFPLAAVHAVITDPGTHFLRPSGFTPALLTKWLSAAADFAGRAELACPGMEHLEVCCNYLPPAGASVLHPHFQVLAGRTAPSLVQASWERSAKFLDTQRASYWDTLVREEEERGERFVAREGDCVWLVPFAPIGAREVMAVVPATTRVAALAAEQVAALATGLSRVLTWYEAAGLSAFNLTVMGGPPGRTDAGHPVVLRVIARAAFKPDYRADDFFLQKQLGTELMFDPPERLAAALREEFSRS